MVASPRRIAYLAVSADGFIADKFGGVGWLEGFGNSSDFGFEGFIAGIDALLMGRRTFDQIMSFGGAWPYGARPTIVLTRHPLTNAPAVARGANEEETTQAMLGAPGQIWIVGGGETLAFCLRRGLVDELHLFQMPILLGEGVPLTGRLHHSTKLALSHSQVLAHGVVKTAYIAAPVPAEPSPPERPRETPEETPPFDAAAPPAEAGDFSPAANVEKDA